MPPAPVENEPAPPAAPTGPAQPPSPELSVKPPAPGGAVTAAISAARNGELNPNTYFADWKDGVPAGWEARNGDKVIAVKQATMEPNGMPVLEFVPDSKGSADLTYRVMAKDAGIAAGDSVLYEVELRADTGAPMDIVLHLLAPDQKDPFVDLHRPYVGEGLWRTLQIAVTIPTAEVRILDVAIRLRGVKPGAIVSMRRASLMLIPPV